MGNDLLSFAEEVLVPIGFMAAIAIGGFFGITEVYGRYTCGNYQEITGKETKWATFDICYIKTDSGWQRWDEYKMRAITNENRPGAQP